MSLLGRLRKSRLLYGMLSALRSHLGRGFMGCCHALFGIRRDKVVFSCFSGASYGDNTVSAVSLFQAAVGLPVTGEADRRTLEVLYGEEVIIAEETPTPGDPAAPFIIRYDPPKPTAKPTKTPKPTAKPTAVPKPTQTPESEASKSDL